MTTLTKITTQLGNILAKAKQQNILLEESRKVINPTFFEILEDVETTDKSLYYMLLLWYNEKYLDTPIDLDNIINSFQKMPKIKEKKSKIYTNEVYGGSCGSLSDSFDRSGRC